MELVGDFPSYDADCGDKWEVFKDKLDNYLTLNNITDSNKKRAIFTSAVCDKTFDNIKDLCYPESLKAKTYDCTGSVFEKRRIFFRAKQTENESVLDWYNRIKELSNGCQFGARISEVIRDRFFSGLQSVVIIQKISEQFGVLKLQQIVDLAVKYECVLIEDKSVNILSSVNSIKIEH